MSTAPHSESATPRLSEGTLQADLNGKTIFLTDWMLEGETVHVYASFEHAEQEKGRSVPYILRRTGGVWWLEPPPEGATAP